jgi:hypothetical protein
VTLKSGETLADDCDSNRPENRRWPVKAFSADGKPEFPMTIIIDKGFTVLRTFQHMIVFDI